MSHETIVSVKRTIYVSQCECGDRAIVEKDPPKERLCNNCGKWVGFKEESYTGPDLPAQKVNRKR